MDCAYVKAEQDALRIVILTSALSDYVRYCTYHAKLKVACI